MKRSIVIAFALAFLFVGNQLVAQVKVSPTVGVNISALDTKLQDISTEARAGWNAGLDFRIGEGMFFLNPGVHYYSHSARLIKDVNGPEDVDLKEETQIQSVRVPLNVGVRLTGEGGLLGIYAKGGITPAYVTGVKEKPSFAFDRDKLNTFTWGANVGVGVDVLFFTVSANYEIGLTDFYKDAEGRNNMFTLSAGLKF